MKYKTGGFEKLTGVTQATLRYYDKEGLLGPQRDESNKYRTYTEDDLARLVQIRQLSSFGIALSDQPARGRSTSYTEVTQMLAQRQKEVENTIEEMYVLLSRLRLHAQTYQRLTEDSRQLRRQNMIGTYRLMLTDPAVSAHPDTPEILQRWLTYAPHTYSCIRIRREQLLAPRGTDYQADFGVGLLKKEFIQSGEVLRAPIQESPPNVCLVGMIETRSLHTISQTVIRPFLEHMRENGMIPIDDMYGWIVYTPSEGEAAPYQISMRVAIG